jgi:hypothetical protein
MKRYVGRPLSGPFMDYAFTRADELPAFSERLWRAIHLALRG